VARRVSLRGDRWRGWSMVASGGVCLHDDARLLVARHSCIIVYFGLVATVAVCELCTIGALGGMSVACFRPTTYRTTPCIVPRTSPTEDLDLGRSSPLSFAGASISLRHIRPDLNFQAHLHSSPAPAEVPVES
jgi:hypothetical protein